MVDSLDKYIVCVENVIPHSLCDELIKEYVDTSEWDKSGIGAENKLDTKIRNVSEVPISSQTIIAKNPEIRQSLDKALFTGAGNAVNGYLKSFPMFNGVKDDTGYILLRYNVGEFYAEHVDHAFEIPRVLSCSFALNDEYEGGEFAFFNSELKIRINKGSAILFPSNFMYPHQILPVTSGVRYSIVTWFR
jgi:predicted 2-oxoglutarate/Fe(II)-dependent dioxygenase YbiX